jgi:hypothetical protein
MAEISRKALKFGLNTQGMKKVELIRAIQAAEGNVACFDTEKSDCDQFACCWRKDCLPQQKRLLL